VTGREREYAPSASERVRSQVTAYERTDGRVGGDVDGVPVIVVSTVGSRSRKTRKAVVMRVEHAGCYALVASFGGQPRNPDWYWNVRVDPRVEIRDGAVIHRMRARELINTERECWWSRALGVWPHYNEYQAMTDRIIPVILLEPAEP
jgi:F420H(2)-dependent quinone reductase